MMKRKFGKYLLAIGIMLMVVMVAVPSVSAFEGHMVDIKAHETIPATKMARLASDTEICYAEKHLGVNIPPDPNPPGVTAWDNIPLNTCVAWIVTIFVQNPLDYTMKNIVINDQFDDNVEMAVMGASQYQGTINISQGNYLNSWYVGDLAPGSGACLTLIVWTKCVTDDNCDENWDWNDNSWHWDWDWRSCWGNADWCGNWSDFGWTYQNWKDHGCYSSLDNNSSANFSLAASSIQLLAGIIEKVNDKFTVLNRDNVNQSISYCEACDHHCHQEFDGRGKYNLNKSGINMGWKDINGVQHSYSGGPYLQITVY